MELPLGLTSSRPVEGKRSGEQQQPLPVVDERGLEGSGLQDNQMGYEAVGQQRQRRQQWWPLEPGPVQPELVAIALGESLLGRAHVIVAKLARMPLV